MTYFINEVEIVEEMFFWVEWTKIIVDYLAFRDDMNIMIFDRYFD
jgi:hypothetical protein